MTIVKTVAQFSMKLYAPISLWHTNAGRVKGKSKEATEINEQLDWIRVSTNSSYKELYSYKEIVTAKQVKGSILGMSSCQETLIEYFKNIMPSTKNGLEKTLKIVPIYTMDVY